VRDELSRSYACKCSLHELMCARPRGAAGLPEAGTEPFDPTVRTVRAAQPARTKEQRAKENRTAYIKLTSPAEKETPTTKSVLR
jgi:hypothetical protein